MVTRTIVAALRQVGAAVAPRADMSRLSDAVDLYMHGQPAQAIDILASSVPASNLRANRQILDAMAAKAAAAIRPTGHSGFIGFVDPQPECRAVWRPGVLASARIAVCVANGDDDTARAVMLAYARADPARIREITYNLLDLISARHGGWHLRRFATSDRS